MASEVITGVGIIHGVANNGSPITMTGFATFVLDGIKGSHKFKLEALEDEAGFDKALIATNAHTELDITWTPSGATRTAAAATAVLVTPLSKVAIANCKVAAFNGDWVYVGDESIELSKSAPAKMSLKVRKYDDNTQNASLTTTVSG